MCLLKQVNLDVDNVDMLIKHSKRSRASPFSQNLFSVFGFILQVKQNVEA